MLEARGELDFANSTEVKTLLTVQRGKLFLWSSGEDYAKSPMAKTLQFRRGEDFMWD